jgi:hypothetical protein
MPSIGIRYCGGCNPQIDRSAIIKNLRENLKKSNREVNFTTDRQRAVDIVVLINGCMHACLEEQYLREGNSPQFISIKGEMVGRHYVKEDHIPEFLNKTIADLLTSPSY